MKAYYAQVANLDQNLGRLIQAVEQAGLADNTIFIFTSDHGEMFGSHGRRAKLIFYEEAARVPFLVRWPGKIQPGTVSDSLLGTPDIMPTILSMMKIPVPAAVEGRDMSSHALGKGGADHEAAHMQGMGSTAGWTDGTEWRALRDHDYTYGIYHRDGKELLFHTSKDPYQLNDLAGDKGSASLLKHYRTAFGDMAQATQRYLRDMYLVSEPLDVDRNIINTASGVKQNLETLQQLTSKWFPNGVGDQSVGLAGVTPH